MELFLDVDGIILDFETSFIDLMRDEYIPDLPDDYVPKNWELHEEFPDIDMEEAWSKFVGSERFAELNNLIDPGRFNQITARFPTYLITNIPNHLIEKRKRNLAKHQFKYKEVFPAGHWDFGIQDYPTKSAIIKNLSTSGKRIVFLDDHPSNCKEVIDNVPNAEVYLMTRPHNQEIPDEDWVRVSGWDEFIEKIGSSSFCMDN